MGVCCGKEELQIYPKSGNQIERSEICPHILTINIHNNYEFRRIIDHGQYGTVREAVRIGSENRRITYAIKSILKKKVRNNTKLLRKELSMLTMLDHPNIVKVFETYEDDKYFHMVLEHCKGGDLMDYMLKQESLTESIAAKIMRTVIISVQYLHANFISHRDVKPENFLFASEDFNSELKLTDFGIAGHFQNAQQMETFIGTPCYMAPEILTGRYGKEVDVWSIGVMLYFLISGKQPFKDFDLYGIFNKIKAAKVSFSDQIWSSLSSESKDLIKSLLVPDPRHRIHLKDALEHPWFRKFSTGTRKAIPPVIFKRLLKMKTRNKLKKEAMRIVVRTLSSEDITDLKEAFIEIDKDNDGYITSEELIEAMQKHHYMVTHEDLTKAITKLTDSQGKINYSSFLMASLDIKNVLNQDVFWESFRYFDSNGDGLIENDEIKIALNRAGCAIETEEMEELRKEANLSSRNGINFREFKSLIDLFDEEYDQNDLNKTISLKYHTKKSDL